MIGVTHTLTTATFFFFTNLTDRSRFVDICVFKVSFSDIDGQRIMIGKTQVLGDLPCGKAQFQPLCYRLSMHIVFTLLDGSYRFAQSDSLCLFGRQRFFGSQTDQIPFKFGKQGEHGHHDLTGHIVLDKVHVLFQYNDPFSLSQYKVDQVYDLGGTASQSAYFRDDQDLVIDHPLEQFLYPSFFL